MATPKAGGWIGGAAFVAVIIMLVAWFFAISPTLATASDTRVESQAQQNENELARVKINNLKKQFLKIDEIKAELAAVQLQIPTKHDLAVFQKQLAAVALAHQVTIVSVAVAPAKELAPPAAAVAETDVTTTETSGSSTPAPTTPTAPVGAAGLYALATSIDVLGRYPDVVAFLQDVQTGIQRLFLVDSISATGQQQTAASAGRPATVPGDLELVITGSLYVLADTAASTATPTPTTPPPALPIPDAAKNPFVPIG